MEPKTWFLGGKCSPTKLHNQHYWGHINKSQERNRKKISLQIWRRVVLKQAHNLHKKGSYEASPRFCEMYEEKYFILALAKKKKKKTFLSLIMRQNLITFPLRTNADLFQYIKMLCCRNGRSYVFSESSIFLLNYIINNSSKYFNQGLWWFIYL